MRKHYKVPCSTQGATEGCKGIPRQLKYNRQYCTRRYALVLYQSMRVYWELLWSKDVWESGEHNFELWWCCQSGLEFLDDSLHEAVPKLSKQCSQPIAAERQVVSEWSNVETHFEGWKKMIDSESLIPSDIWNFDETGFWIGCLRDRILITHASQKSGYTADPQNHKSVTVIDAVSAAGDTIDPTVIIQGAVFKEKYFTTNLTEGTDWQWATQIFKWHAGLGMAETFRCEDKETKARS